MEQQWLLVIPVYSHTIERTGNPFFKFVDIGPFSNTLLRSAYKGDSNAMAQLMQQMPTNQNGKKFNIVWSKIKVKPIQDITGRNILSTDPHGYRLDDIFSNQDYFNEDSYKIVATQEERAFDKTNPGVLSESGAFGGRRRTKSKKSKKSTKKSRKSPKKSKKSTKKSTRRTRTMRRS